MIITWYSYIIDLFTEFSYNQDMSFREIFKDENIASLAREAGLPYSTVSEIANGKKSLEKCNAGTVYSLAIALGTTVEKLLVAEKGSKYPDIYSLNERQSIFLAKRMWDENIYCGMKMENRNVTFPQTKTVLEGINVPDVRLEDITAILNMRDAWVYLIKTVKTKITLEYICTINGFIARNEALEWGVLRTGNVLISGTDYHPPVPVREQTEKDIQQILSSYESVTEKALSLFCYIVYKQLFWDGNKRTAMTAANKILVSGGAGFLTIRDADMVEFNSLLTDMFNSGETVRIKEFLYRKAIIGMNV